MTLIVVQEYWVVKMLEVHVANWNKTERIQMMWVKRWKAAQLNSQKVILLFDKSEN